MNNIQNPWTNISWDNTIADCDKGYPVKIGKFVKSNQRFVISVAAQYQRKELTLEELIEIGNEGLVKAAEEYDLNADSKFISYAVERMRQRIVQAIGEKQ